MDKMYKQKIMSGQQEPETWEKTEPEQSKEPVSLKRIVIGTDKKLPKAGEKVLAKITIPSKTMEHFYEVIYHNGESWLPQRVFQDGNKIIDFKPVEECL